MSDEIEKGIISIIDENSISNIDKYEGKCICKKKPKGLFFILGERYSFRQEDSSKIIIQDESKKEVIFTNNNNEKQLISFGDYFEVY